ncbi:CD225/dispanin family protein [Streptomyces sp. SP17BM10]|uniref:CD225/dispanin family protein n=1 Tax=Streptomyces sp. SP17BM10 TaxID=3002530 RepID=UPI002E7A52C7|nr:CD225/dispanin family protein [Streptomyces sp. SP17BM10]MEE1788771.1 CD225/dispanin family protein [Streptomyces sp. SP17BM10]
MSDRYEAPPPDEDWGPEQTPWTASDRNQTHHRGGPQPSSPPWSGQPPHWQPAPEQAPSSGAYLVGAILVTVLCFPPTGIAAIYFAAQISSRTGAGDVYGAVSASKKARLWIIVSLVIGVLVWIVLIASASSTPPSTSG